MQPLDQQRRLWRRAGVAVAVLAVLSFAFPVASLAGGGSTFTDVPPSHPFVDEIEQVAAAGIANGFSNGTYRPSQPVTRQAMAAFLSRAGSSVGRGDTFNTLLSNSFFQTMSITIIDVPGDESTTQRVHVRGTIRFDDDFPDPDCDPSCVVSARILWSDGPVGGPIHHRTLITQQSDTSHQDTLLVDAVFTVPGGQQGFLLEARYEGSDPIAVSVENHMSATVIPFSADF